MYVDSSSVTVNHKTYTRHLLRASYRQGGKVCHRTIANISECADEEIRAIKLGLKHKGNLAALISVEESLKLQQGLPVGAVWLLFSLAKQLNLVKALGSSIPAKLALWQVIARIIDQGSRLSAVRLASSHAACDIVNLDAFNEDDLYLNLDWLCENQSKIENRLFQSAHAQSPPALFLYDVTSSYLEGTQNALGGFGYNRDGKRGKMQIVVGLLCDEEGVPLSIEVFPGNTQDTKTFANQVKKVAERFGGGEVTFVGDRGMIRAPQIKELKEFKEHKFHYISALSKPQIGVLLRDGVLQMSFFDETVIEVLPQDNRERYVLRRNPIRAAQVKQTRQNKLNSLEKAVEKYNLYLKEHPKARVEVGQRKMQEKAKILKVKNWVEILDKERELSVRVKSTELYEEEKLDGCYVLRTDLTQDVASKETIHQRYKDLALVEQVFRTSKTTHLEMRPVFVQRDTRTRGHAFVVMMAYLIVHALSEMWREFDLTVEEGIHQLATICAQEVFIDGKPMFQTIPEPREDLKRLLDAANVTLPKAIPYKGVVVSTRKKLPERRVKR